MVDTLEFEYHILELIQSDAGLSRKFGEELTKSPLNLDGLSNIIKLTESMDSTIAVKKVKHAIENQVPSAKEVIREIAVQNTIDAYFDLENFLTKRNEKIEYPLKVDVTCLKKEGGKCDLQIRDYATGMTLHDVLYRYFTIGDTSKQDKSYHVGGHGRGAKAGIHYCKRLVVESFGKKTTAENKGSGKYTLRIGESSEVREGTKITLEDMVIKEDPLLALKDFAGKVTNQFDFRFNGIKVNKEDDSKELGKLPMEETRKVKGTELELTDKLQASSKQAEGLELKQSVMTIFEKPLGIEYLRRVLSLPTGYLLSRSRNEVPKPVQDVLENKEDKAYKKFFQYLHNNLSKIGAFEFRFMDSFSKRKDNLSKIATGSYKLVKNSVIAFMVGAALFFSVENGVKPGIEEVAYLFSKNNYFSITKLLPDLHRPIADVQEFIVSLFGDSRFFSRIRKNPLGYYDSGRDIFFKLTSYNTVTSNGSWTNTEDKRLNRRIKGDANLEETIWVRLNLDAYMKWSFLPVPIGHIVIGEGRGIEVWKGGARDLPYDIYLVHAYDKPKGEFPIRYAVVKRQELISELEEKEFNPVKEQFTKVPFKISYPKDLEAKLNRLNLSKFTEEEKATLTAGILRDYLTYNTSRKNNIRYIVMDNVVNDPLKSKQVDCDVANGILGVILRERYGIPTRLALGLQGQGGVLIVNSGHGVCEAYIKGKGWVGLDATPVNLNQEMIRYEGPSRLSKLFLWLRNIFNLGNKKPADKEQKGEVINEYTRFSPGNLEGGYLSKMFRKTMYYGYTAKDFVLDNRLYFLLGSGGLLLLGGYNLLMKRRKTGLKNIPLVETWVKEDGSAYEEKISINQGIRHMKKGVLMYDKQVVEGGLENLAISGHDMGRYVVDYNFYLTLLEMGSSDTKRAPYLKKEEDGEEKIIIPELLKKITFGDETIKERNPEEKTAAYYDKIAALQKITTGICKANKLSDVHVSGEYKFKDKEKLLSFKNSIFRPSIYVNIDNETLDRDPGAFYRDEKLLDSLVFTVALTQDRNIGEINEMKKKYLNKVVLGGE